MGSLKKKKFWKPLFMGQSSTQHLSSAAFDQQRAFHGERQNILLSIDLIATSEPSSAFNMNFHRCRTETCE